MARLFANEILDHAKRNPQGFTLDISTMKPVQKGIAVAYSATQNSFGLSGLNQVIQHALKHDQIIGGWFNSENGEYYFDSVKIFPNHQEKEAIEFGRKNQQIAVYDLTAMQEIRL